MRKLQVSKMHRRRPLMWLDDFSADSRGAYLFVSGLPEKMSGTDIAAAFGDYAVLPPRQHRRVVISMHALVFFRVE